jgi:hypothetical protein
LKQHIIIAELTEEATLLKLASLALFLVLPRATRTMEAKIPIIAITINNSIKVKPFFHKKYNSLILDTRRVKNSASEKINNL